MKNRKTTLKIQKWKGLKIRMPILRLRDRLFLYVGTIIFGALALIHAIMETFHFMLGIVFYVCAAITLFASCYYMALDVRYNIRGKMIPRMETNPLINRVTKDYRYRTVLFAIPGLIQNLIFAIFNGVIGIVSGSTWFITMALYYMLLSAMRFSAVKYEKNQSKQKLTKERVLDELLVSKRCGILLIVMTIILGGAVILMVTLEEGKHYPGVTIYAVAAYTFYKIIISIINVVKARKLKSPLLMTIRNIGHMDACVSILLLQTAMFAAFGGENRVLIRAMNGITGTVVCCIILMLGVYEIRLSTQMEKALLNQKESLASF